MFTYVNWTQALKLSLMGAGRPSQFNPKFCQAIIKYFSIKPYRKVRSGKTTREVANDTPTFAGFAASIGVHRDTLHQWCKDHDEFSDAYKRAKELQENFLVVNGNKSLINAAFAIFTAKNVLGWREKQPGEEEKTIINNYSKLSDEELDRRITKLKGEVE